MKKVLLVISALVASYFVLGASACNGSKPESTMDKVKDAAHEAGEHAHEAAEEAGQAVEEAAEGAQEAVEGH